MAETKKRHKHEAEAHQKEMPGETDRPDGGPRPETRSRRKA